MEQVLGHHSCPRSLKEMLSDPALSELGAPLRLVIPPVTPGLSERFALLLERIGTRTDVTLTLNDWGALAHCAARKREGRLAAVLCLGALLSGQDTDPVLETWTHPQPDHLVLREDGVVRLRWTPPPETLAAHWRCPSAVHMAPLLRSLAVEEVELCRQALEPPSGIPGFRISYLPYAILSVQPCGGDCARCGGPALRRCGKTLKWDRNMLTVPAEDAPPPEKL